MSARPNILPKPADAPPAGATAEPAAARCTPQRKVGVACKACQSRRTKCDGARPSCQACVHRKSRCEWATAPGQSHSQARKQQIMSLEKDKSAMFEILWYLQTTAPERATELLHRLRSVQGGDVGAMLDYIARDRSDQSTMGAPMSAAASSASLSSSSSSSVSSSSASARRSLPFTQAGEAFSLSNPVLTGYPESPFFRSPDAAGSLVFARPPPGQNATIHGARPAIDMFFWCIGGLFYVSDKADVDRTVRRFADLSDGLTLADLVSRAGSLEVRALAAELAGMAAMGSLHLVLRVPDNAPSIEMADYFYAVAKHGLDSAILYNPLRAMKVCTLVAFYNIALHATVALAYIELGLSLARNHGLNNDTGPPGISRAELADYKRTRRTLIQLQCWLSASLDYLPESLSNNLQLVVDEEDCAPEHVIQREAVKVTVIKARIHHHLPDGYVSEVAVAELRAKLNAFYENLPNWMKLDYLLIAEPDSPASQHRAVIFYVHLFYVSAMMLLSRRLMIAHFSPDATGRVSIGRESSLAIEEGYMAAKANARVLSLMLAEGSVVQTCWLCIFTAYTSCTMILYCATQKALSNLPSSSWASDFELISKCFQTLTFCALKDRLAGSFRDNLARYVAVLHDYQGQNDQLHKGNEASLSDVLFTMHPGTTNLHQAARDLLRLIHRPFSGPGAQEPHLESTMTNCIETTLGTHLEWQWELKGPKAGTGIAHENAPMTDLLLHNERWTTWTPFASARG